MTVKEAIFLLAQCDPNKQLDCSVYVDRYEGFETWVGSVDRIEDGPHLDAVIVYVTGSQRVD